MVSMLLIVLQKVAVAKRQRKVMGSYGELEAEVKRKERFGDAVIRGEEVVIFTNNT